MKLPKLQEKNKRTNFITYLSS